MFGAFDCNVGLLLRFSQYCVQEEGCLLRTVDGRGGLERVRKGKERQR